MFVYILAIVPQVKYGGQYMPQKICNKNTTKQMTQNTFSLNTDSCCGTCLIWSTTVRVSTQVQLTQWMG